MPSKYPGAAQRKDWGQVVIDVKKKLLKTALRGGKYKVPDPSASRKNKKRTSPERAMMDILGKMNIPYEEEYSIPFTNTWRVYDFLLLDTDILIEVDGDYIHGNREVVERYNAMHFKNMQNDKVKNWIAKERGFQLLRFWQSTIENDPDLVMEKISKALQQGVS
jgi:hypothetical protein